MKAGRVGVGLIVGVGYMVGVGSVVGVGGEVGCGCNVAVALGVSVGGWGVGVGIGCWGAGVSLAGRDEEGIIASGVLEIRRQASSAKQSNKKMEKERAFFLASIMCIIIAVFRI